MYKLFNITKKYINPYTLNKFSLKTMNKYRKHLKYILKSKHDINFYRKYYITKR